MDQSINASFSYNKSSASRDLSIGNTSSKTIATINKISNFSSSIRTFGGLYGIGTFTTAKAIEDINVDLTTWINSLNDTKTHVPIEFNNLKLISEFIHEENFKREFTEIIKSINNPYAQFAKSLTEPQITIKTDLNYCGYYVLSLTNRFGHEYLLKDGLLSIKNCLEVEENAKKIATEFKKNNPIFANLKVVLYKDVEELIPNLTSIYTNSFTLNSPDIIDLKNLKKYKNPYTNINYLLDETGKIGFSYYDNYMLDTYSMKQIVNSLPFTQTIPNLETYLILGL